MVLKDLRSLAPLELMFSWGFGLSQQLAVLPVLVWPWVY